MLTTGISANLQEGTSEQTYHTVPLGLGLLPAYSQISVIFKRTPHMLP